MTGTYDYLELPWAMVVWEAVEAQRNGNLDKAEHILGKLIDLFPTDFHPLHLKGIIRLQRGDAAGSLELISRALAADPSHKEWYKACLSYASALRAQKRTAEALHFCATAIGVRPDHAPAYALRAEIHCDLAQHAEALMDYRIAQQLQPADESLKAIIQTLEQLIARASEAQ